MTQTSPRQDPRRYGSLRLRAVRAAGAVARALGGRALYRRAYLGPGRFVVREEELRVPDLPRGLDGFSIAHVTDLHAGPFLGGGDLDAVVAELIRLAPDLMAITGDLITDTYADALPILPDLGRVRPRHGTYAVFGNHDYHGRLEGRIADAAAREGIRFLRNECVRIDTGDGVLGVVGLEDLEEARVLDVDTARTGLRSGDVEIVLCHNPLGARDLAREGCPAILAGHTHGGQIDLPPVSWWRGIGAHPGLRIAIGPTTLIVNRGLGVTGIPLRVRVPSEIVVVRVLAG